MEKKEIVNGKKLIEKEFKVIDKIAWMREKRHLSPHMTNGIKKILITAIHKHM